MTHQEKNHQQTLLTAINEALSARTHAAIGDRVALRNAVCAYLAAEQARGSTVESVIQAVKEILMKADDGAAATNGELAHQLVASCLEFYGTTGLRSV